MNFKWENMSLRRILYVSTLCDHETLDYLFTSSLLKPGLAVQKFHRLMVDGIRATDQVARIEALSALSVTSENHKRLFWNIPPKKENGIHYRYVPFLNINFLKNLMVFFYTFFRVLFLNFLYRNKENLVFCDVLNLSIASASLFASKLTWTKTVGIVTDLPSFMVQAHSGSLKHDLYKKASALILGGFSCYVLLTEQMNRAINRRNKPYIVMEGLCDRNAVFLENTLANKPKEKIVMYAGGIYKRYGIKKLIEAFSQLEDRDIRLHIYGAGELESEMPYYTSLDCRIVYYGVVPVKDIVRRELEATLLVNPRPSDEEFTCYSFPSKNMEYMVSATPLVTTPLAGIPKEYYEYVYVFQDETVDGIRNTLKYLLNLGKTELHKKGHLARQFVLQYKNNEVQARRILELCRG